MKASVVVVAALALASVAEAGPPPLAPYKGANLTVSFPKGWTVAQQSGMYVVQQDPKRADAADIVFIYTAANASATEDALLDGITKQLAPDFKAAQRGAVSARGGHLVIGEGNIGGVHVRAAAVAAIANGQALVCVFVAKPADFDAMGGLGLVGAVLATFAPAGDQAAPAQASPPTGATPSGKVPTLADITGEWAEDSHADETFVNTHNGNYAGFYATSVATKMTFDGKGRFSLKGRYAIVSSDGVSGGKIEQTGAIAIKGNVLVYQQSNWKNPEFYYIRGYDVRPGLTRLKLNGHWNSEADALKAADPNFAKNLDTYWVHVTK